MVGIEDLRQKDPEGDEGREEAIAERNRLGIEGLLNLLGWQVFGQRKASGLDQLLAEGTDWAGQGTGSRMSHRRPPCQKG